MSLEFNVGGVVWKRRAFPIDWRNVDAICRIFLETCHSKKKGQQQQKSHLAVTTVTMTNSPERLSGCKMACQPRHRLPWSSWEWDGTGILSGVSCTTSDFVCLCTPKINSIPGFDMDWIDMAYGLNFDIFWWIWVVLSRRWTCLTTLDEEEQKLFDFFSEPAAFGLGPGETQCY